MNKKQHVKIGKLVGIVGVTYIGINKIKEKDKLELSDGIELGLFFIGSILGSCLPDILEPATSSYHRKFFHSYSMLFFNIYELINSEIENKYVKSVFNGFLAGYASHLIADLTTPRRLPIV